MDEALEGQGDAVGSRLRRRYGSLEGDLEFARFSKGAIDGPNVACLGDDLRRTRLLSPFGSHLWCRALLQGIKAGCVHVLIALAKD